ncbi:MAG: glycosyltransferase family 2 protein [Phycisphaerales bacterium]
MANSQPNPLPLSVAIICKDAGATIERTLASVKGLASEIVVVDSGSTDETLAIAERHGATVHREGWPGFAAQKNLAMSRCSKPWILCLDADESLDDACAQSIRDVIARSDAGDGYEVNRMVHWNGTPLRHAWHPEWRLRLVRAGAATWTGERVHESLVLNNGTPTARLGGTVRHDAIGSISDFLARQITYGRLSAETLAERGERGSVRKLVTSPVTAWLKMLIARRAYKDGWRGWVAASSVALASIAKHAALLELTRDAEQRDG